MSQDPKPISGFDPRSPVFPILVLGAGSPIGGLVPAEELHAFQAKCEAEGIPVALLSAAGWEWFLAQPGREVLWFGSGPVPPELGGERPQGGQR